MSGGVMYRTCFRCGETKSMSQFREDGVWCRDCRKEIEDEESGGLSDRHEDEGEKEVRVHFTGGERPLSPEVEQALAKAVQRIMEQEPVHADEPEGEGRENE